MIGVKFNKINDFQIYVLHSVWIIISSFMNLFHRVLSANRIAEVKSDYFCVLMNLQYLYLDQNLLTDEKFPNDALDCMAKLFYL